MLGMPGTSGGVRDGVNLIILSLIAFEIHLSDREEVPCPYHSRWQPASRSLCLAGVGMEVWVRVGLASRQWAKGREVKIAVFKAISCILDG